jgi:hypothetical protein
LFCQPDDETRRGRQMRLARRGDLVQSAAHKAAAEDGIDLLHADRNGSRFLLEPGRPLERAHTLTQIVQHGQAFDRAKKSFEHEARARLFNASVLCLF